MVNYKFSPSILEKFGSYLNSSRIYQQYYGFSEDPVVTEEEFEQKKFRELIDGINKVPLAWEDSESADKGTAFNEVVDCIIEGRKSEKMQIESDKESQTIRATFNGREFAFPTPLCRGFADYFKGAITQQYVEANIDTKYGEVMLYGYVDEILPFKAADIKTTGRYNAFKYRDSWQRVVYMYCLDQMGYEIKEFEFVITDFRNIWQEVYGFDTDKDRPALTEHCEFFIEFLEANKDKIVNLKIFARE